MSRHQLRHGLRQSSGLGQGGTAVPWLQDRAELLASLVGFWKLDEASGSRADSIGANTLTSNNSVGSAVGTVYSNAALLVPGSNTYLSIADNAAVSMGDIDFWMAVWVYPLTVTGNQSIIAKVTTATAATYEYFLRLTAGQATLIIGNGVASSTTLTNTNTLTANQWSLIIAYHDSANAKSGLSVFGGAYTTGTHSTGLYDGTNAMLIGARLSADTVFNGRIGPVMLGKGYVPDAADITFLNNSGAGRTLANMQAYAASIAEIDGMWSWFTNPRAVYYNGKTYTGTVDTAGDVSIYQFNHATYRMTTFPLRRALQEDDHDHPSILIRDSDKRLITFYCKHNDTTIYQRISTNAENITVWGTEASLNTALGSSIYTYPCPVQLTGEASSPIYLFFRSQSASIPGIYYSKSTDGGVTWSTAVRVFANSTQRPYFHLVANGTTRIDFVVSDGHPVEVATNSLYHCYYQSGNIYKTDGTLVGAIDSGPYTPSSSLTKVYDGTTNPSWNWDIAIDGSGYPVIVYAQFQNTFVDHFYRYARWTGSAWADNQVVAGGSYLYSAEKQYSGGICLDHADVNTVYLSKQVSSQWEIWRYMTADNGATWDAGVAITSGSSVKNIRPYVPINSVSALKTLWVNGTYTSFTNYDMNVLTSPNVVGN